MCFYEKYAYTYFLVKPRSRYPFDLGRKQVCTRAENGYAYFSFVEGIGTLRDSVTFRSSEKICTPVFAPKVEWYESIDYPP